MVATVVIVVKLGKNCVQFFSPRPLVQVLSHRHERHCWENIQCLWDKMRATGTTF